MSGISKLGEKSVFFDRTNIIETEGNKKLRTRNTPENLQLINDLFNHLSPEYSNSERLRLNLEMGVSQFYKENYAFSVENKHIVQISKNAPGEPAKVAVANVSEKSFARGGFGKVYSVKVLGSEENLIALKLSRKKLDKTMDKLNALSEPTARGKIAKESIEHELRIINYIRKYANSFIGLNVEVYGQVSFNHQLGYFVKRFACDGLDFRLKYELSPENCYEFMQKVLKGLRVLHLLNLVHRDIKLENILVNLNGELINGTESPSFDVVLGDFGNVAHLDELFLKFPYPTLNRLFGCATPCYVSKKYVDQVAEYLEKLNNYKQNDSEYNQIVNDIKQVLRENDKFAISLAFYMLWLNKKPSFNSFTKKEHFSFNRGATEQEKLIKIKQMGQELLSVSLHLSQQKYNDSERIALAVMTPLIDGLDSKAFS